MLPRDAPTIIWSADVQPWAAEQDCHSSFAPCSFQTTFASMSTNTKLQQGYRKAKKSANRVGQKLLARFRSSAAGTGKTTVSWPLKSKRSSKTDAEATAHRYIELYRSQQAGFDLWTVRRLPLLLSPHKVAVSSTWSGSTTKAAAFLAWCPQAGPHCLRCLQSGAGGACAPCCSSA